jgi:hypothetical protein
MLWETVTIDFHSQTLVVGEGDVRRRGVVGVFTTIVVAMVVVFATLADSTVFKVDAIARVRGNDTTVEEHVLPKSSTNII